MRVRNVLLLDLSYAARERERGEEREGGGAELPSRECHKVVILIKLCIMHVQHKMRHKAAAGHKKS